MLGKHVTMKTYRDFFTKVGKKLCCIIEGFLSKTQERGKQILVGVI